MGEQVCLGLAVVYGVDVVAVVRLDVAPARGVVVGAVTRDATLASAEDASESGGVDALMFAYAMLCCLL